MPDYTHLCMVFIIARGGGANISPRRAGLLSPEAALLRVLLGALLRRLLGGLLLALGLLRLVSGLLGGLLFRFLLIFVIIIEWCKEIIK